MVLDFGEKRGKDNMKMNAKELEYVLDSFMKDKKHLSGLWSFEEYCRFFVRRCNECGKIFILKYEDYDSAFCEECRVKISCGRDRDFEYFDRNKETIYYERNEG